MAVGWNDSTASVSSVTDSSGNTYQRAVGPTSIAGTLSQSIYYARNILAAAAGANTVTVQFSTGAAFPDIRILEYSGADLANPIDVTAGATGSGGTTNSGSATTTNATDLIFGANMVTGTTSGPGTGFTQRVLTSPDSDIAEDRAVTATGSYSATAPASGSWVMQMVAFRTPVSTVDTQAPTAPGNLTGSAISGNQINLSWTASTDNVGVTEYLVERCQGVGCTTFAQIGTRRNDIQRYGTDGEYELQLSGTSDGRGREPEPVLERGECDHIDSGHAAADGADESDGDGDQRKPDQSELDGVDGQRGSDRISG